LQIGYRELVLGCSLFADTVYMFSLFFFRPSPGSDLVRQKNWPWQQNDGCRKTCQLYRV